MGGVLLLPAETAFRRPSCIVLMLRGLTLVGSRCQSPRAHPRRPVLIEEISCQIKAALIVIEPIMAFLGVDANGDQKVRGALTPLKSFAERAGSRL